LCSESPFNRIVGDPFFMRYMPGHPPREEACLHLKLPCPKGGTRFRLNIKCSRKYGMPEPPNTRERDVRDSIRTRRKLQHKWAIERKMFDQNARSARLLLNPPFHLPRPFGIRRRSSSRVSQMNSSDE